MPLLLSALVAVAAPPLGERGAEGVALGEGEAAPTVGEAEALKVPPPPLLPLEEAVGAALGVVRVLAVAVAHALPLPPPPTVPVEEADKNGVSLPNGKLAVAAGE